MLLTSDYQVSRMPFDKLQTGDHQVLGILFNKLLTRDHQVSGMQFISCKQVIKYWGWHLRNVCLSLTVKILTDTNSLLLFYYLVLLTDLVLFQVTGPWYLLS